MKRGFISVIFIFAILLLGVSNLPAQGWYDFEINVTGQPGWVLLQAQEHESSTWINLREWTYVNTPAVLSHLENVGIGGTFNKVRVIAGYGQLPCTIETRSPLLNQTNVFHVHIGPTIIPGPDPDPKGSSGP